MKPLSECHLYTFVDTAHLNGRDPVEVARQLCAGGSDLVQLRAKGWPLEDVRRLASRLLPITEAAGVGLVINDHPQLAVEIGAPLCHLGQEDFFDAGHQRALEVTGSGGRLGLGLSTHAPEQALRALLAAPAYLAVGPVYATATKPTARAVTLEYVRWAARHLTVPWFAIGGIALSTLPAVVDAGARRICVVSAILNAPDIARACQEFKERLTCAPSK